MSFEEHQRRVEERRTKLKSLVDTTFAEKKRVILEIGCGHGHWMVDFAKTRADRFCVGIDLIGERIERAKKKSRAAELENVVFLRAEAVEMLELLPSETVLEEIYILFPDPWPKKRHWKNRLVNAQFLNRIARFCQAGVTAHFRTDHEGYFDWAKEIVAEHPLWDIDLKKEWPFEKETVFQNRADSYQSLIFARNEVPAES